MMAASNMPTFLGIPKRLHVIELYTVHILYV